MRWLSWLGCFGAAAGLGVLTLVAAPEVHPSQKNRWIERRGDFTVEYSAGDEAYLDDIFAALERWRTERPEILSQLEAHRAEPLPMSPADLRTNRDEILGRVAKEIGLPGPTAVQGRTYDAMLGYYERIGLVRRILAEAFIRFSEVRTVTLWRKADLAARLKAGEAIPRFRYAADTDEVNFDFNFAFEGGADAEARKELSEQGLDHAFNYKTQPDGVVDFSASFTLKRGAKLGEPLRPSEPDAQLERMRATLMAAFAKFEVSAFPMVITPKNAGLDPANFATKEIDRAADMLNFAGNAAAYRELPIVHVVLHEAVEVGIVENYLGSADRRWLCDGTANYVGWKIIRDLSDVATADQAYSLASQLAQYAGVQPKINLRKWPAVEKETEADKQSGLMRAHYPFATRALVGLVQQSGEDAVPKLFREIARTPRRKVTMATVEKAYQKVTGKKLADLIALAEQAPVPTLNSAFKTSDVPTK